MLYKFIDLSLSLYILEKMYNASIQREKIEYFHIQSFFLQ